MKNGVFLGIGVQDYEGGLPPLKGAHRSVAALGAWAVAQGYQTQVLTDEDGPIDAKAIGREMKDLLEGGGQSRIVVAFAGHGMRRDGTEELWLLSQWKNSDGAIDIGRFRDRLRTYRPKQIAFLSDACRTLPPNEARHVSGVAAIRFQDYDPDHVEVVTYHSTVESAPALSTPSDALEPYCFFSRVMFDTLRGVYSNGESAVDERSLRATLRRELPLLAAQYGRTQKPDPEGGFIDNPHWSDLNRDMQDLPPLDLPQPETIEMPEMSTSSNESDLEDATSSIGVITGQSVGASHVSRGHVERRRLVAAKGRDRKFTDLLTSPAQQTEYAILHGKIAETEHSIPIEAKNPDSGASVLLQIDTGYWIGAARWQGAKPIFGLDGNGAILLSLSNRRRISRRLVQDLVTASLGGRITDLAELAAKVRGQEHRDPIFGVIAAYAYLGMGAYDDVRRIATFYIERNELVPFDVALACRVPMEWTGRGYFVSIPAVAAREPLNAAESERAFTHEARKACCGAVAGHFPWLRQGWSWLSETRNDRILDTLKCVEPGLKKAMFTTLTPKAGRCLLAFLQEIST